MPLKKGFTRRSIGANIKTEERAGRPRRQALAIALNVARKAAAKAGKPGKGPKARGDRRRRLARMGRKLRGMQRQS